MAKGTPPHPAPQFIKVSASSSRDNTTSTGLCFKLTFRVVQYVWAGQELISEPETLTSGPRKYVFWELRNNSGLGQNE